MRKTVSAPALAQGDAVSARTPHAMTIFVTFNEGIDSERHQCYKITLPVKWRRAPCG